MLIAAFVLLVIVVASSIWLTVEGFKKHIIWGIGIVFVPFVALIFTAVHWGKAKKPFLTYLISSVLLAAVIFEPMRVVMQEYDQLSRKFATGEITQQQFEDMLGQRTIRIFRGKSPVFDDEDLLTPEEQRIESLRAELESRNEEIRESQAYAADKAKQEEKVAEVLRKVQIFSPIKIAQANQYIGKKVRIVDFDGIERQGILINAGYDRFTIERKFAGGRVKFDVLIKNIKTLEVQKTVLR